jgi:hypothetical protein
MVVDEAEAVVLACSVVIQVALRRSILQLGHILVAFEEGVIRRPNADEQVRPLPSLEISALMGRMVLLVDKVQALGISRGATEVIPGFDRVLR